MKTKGSIQKKITALTIAAILISVLSFGVIGIYFVTVESNRMSGQNLGLICENRKDALNEYLRSIEQSVGMISRYATDSLDGVVLTEDGVLGASGEGVTEKPGRSKEQRKDMDRYFDEHLALIETAFKSVANHTNGISSCYYRINPEITTELKGFFFTKENSSDFRKIEMTDIAAYKPDDLDHVGWYFIPLRQGRPSWIEPYDSAKLEENVISYVVPIYKSGTFIGVLGMDIPFETLVKQVEQFANFETGYFALTDGKGKIYYHPDYEMGTDVGKYLPQLVTDMKRIGREKAFDKPVTYEKDGAKWQLTYSTLDNDMKLFAVVKDSEINSSLYNLERLFVITGILILLLFTIMTTVFMRRMTVPLTDLAKAARRLAEGDYDVRLDYEGDDELGVLVDSFTGMRDRLKTNISDLSKKAFRDDLTGVKSKHAYVEAEDEMNQLITDKKIGEFAVALFDLNDLKVINDTKGHEVGDEYIRSASGIICNIFKHSPVYRIGGDEFVAVLRGSDYENREKLFRDFEKKMDENMEKGDVTIASGYSVFDPASDKNYRSVFRRADESMYVRKKQMKE